MDHKEHIASVTSFSLADLRGGISFAPKSEQLLFNKALIFKGLGMKPSDADEYLLSLIDKLADECFPLIRPKLSMILYENIDIIPQENTISIEGTTFTTGKIVTQSLKNSTALLLFSSTIGEDLELYSRKLMKEGHALEGLIVDLIGSELTEAVVEYLHLAVEQIAKPAGLNVSNRYSPGYCNWPVSDQQHLFPLLKEFDCGITLTESSLMVPVKSISGIIGIGPSLKKTAYKCSVCADTHCLMRTES